jgi:DUF438 domain-containing protein
VDPIEELRLEHEQIERELVELESISESEIINYPNLVHVFKKLCSVWNPHEKKEERIFPILEKENIKIPVKTILFEHKELRKHKDAIQNAIDSGSEIEMKKALNTSGKTIIKKLKKHINDEDNILYTIVLDELSPEGLRELWTE